MLAEETNLAFKGVSNDTELLAYDADNLLCTEPLCYYIAKD